MTTVTGPDHLDRLDQLQAGSGLTERTFLRATAGAYSAKEVKLGRDQLVHFGWRKRKERICPPF